MFPGKVILDYGPGRHVAMGRVVKVEDGGGVCCTGGWGKGMLAESGRRQAKGLVEALASESSGVWSEAWRVGASERRGWERRGS